MISGNFKDCTTLEKFYEQITKLHKQHHGDNYCDVHDAIREALSPYGKRYIELGINQGATLAAACLAGLESCHAYDLHIDRFNPYRHLFADLEFPFIAETGNSLKIKRRHCDVLYIDTTHTKVQLAQELTYWAPFVSETIICHDTKSKSELHDVCVQFSEFNSKIWFVKERNTKSVGYTVLSRC